MKTDLIASDLINNPSKDANTLYEQHHTTLTTLIDIYAPLHTKILRQSISRDGLTKLYLWQKRPSLCSKGFGAEINLTSVDLKTCRKSTNTTESACRPNQNFLKQKFRITTMTPKNYVESLAMCYTDCQPRCYHR